MNEKLLSLKDEIKSRLGETQDLTDLDKIRVSYLGKKGSITALLKGMKDLPNEERKTFGAEVNKLKAQAAQLIEERLAELKEKEIPYVVISLGGDGALLVCEKGIYQGKPPKIEIASTVGCGDSMVGAFAVALEKKMEPEAALKYAVSVASANALSPHTGRFDPKDRDEIIKNVEIIKLA